MAPRRKVSVRQMEILLDFAERNKHIALGRFSCSVQGQQAARRAWQSVALHLNAVGFRKRTPEQWRRYWVEFKAKIKAKAADSRRGSIEAEGLRLLPLNKWEQRLMALLDNAAEGTNDADLSDTQVSCPTDSPFDSNGTSLEVEWLECESHSEEQPTDEELDEQQLERRDEPVSTQFPQPIQAGTEVERVSYKERWKNQRNPYMNHMNKISKVATSYKKIIQRDSDKPTSPVTEEHHSSQKKSKRPSLSEVAATALEYFQSKKVKAQVKQKGGQDPDMSFLYSVLPEMRVMTPEQKRRFKLGVLSLANTILEQDLDKRN